MKLIKLALMGALSFSTTIGLETSVLAEEKAKMNSTTDIIFKENTDPTDPTNPEKPDETVKPEKPDEHEKGTPGPLSINYVSNVHFGEQKISSQDKTYNAQLDKVKQNEKTIEVANFISVTDNRGTNTGWKLKVKQNGQFKSGTNELKGAVISMKNPFLNSVVPKGAAPTASSIKLDPNGATVDVATANKDKGMGSWTIAYGKDKTEGKKSITLDVPGTSAKVKDAKYSTTLTWTLEDTPN